MLNGLTPAPHLEKQQSQIALSLSILGVNVQRLLVAEKGHLMLTINLVSPSQVVVGDVVFRVEPYELVVEGDGLLILMNCLATLLNFQINQRCRCVFPDNFFEKLHGLAELPAFEEIISLFYQKPVLSFYRTNAH